jgi:hypothetical protein
MPEDGAELHPATEALQALKWDDDDDTPLGSETIAYQIDPEFKY